MNHRPFFILVIIVLMAAALQGQPRHVSGESPSYLTGAFLIVWGDGSAENPQALA